MSLKKIAFFVEGYTEQYFLESLLLEIFAEKNIAIEISKIKGGSSIPIKISNIKSSNITDQTQYFVLIYNCGGDSNVKSYILERRQDLINAQYSKIVGFRDIYPNFTRGEIHKLQYGLKQYVPQKDIKIEFILSIMEIESWFIAEHSHFQKINQNLTAESVSEFFGYNISHYNTELIDSPANKLNEIYNTVGEIYDKSTESIDRTIESLDYGNLYFDVREKINSLNELIESFEEIFN